MQQRIVGGPALDRRGFLKGGTAVLALAGVSPWLLATSGGTAGAELGRAEFEALVGQWFQVGGPTGVPLQLVAVQDGPASRRVAQYTLQFRGGPGAALEEGIHDVSPPAGSEFALYLQPTGHDGSELRVRASFAVIEPLAPSACAARG